MVWRYDLNVQSDSTVHVWPDSDAVEHDLVGVCVCGPRLVEQANGNVIVVHHSLDGREASEPPAPAT